MEQLKYPPISETIGKSLTKIKYQIKHARVEKLKNILIKNKHLTVILYSPNNKSEMGCKNCFHPFLTKAKPFCIGKAVTYGP